MISIKIKINTITVYQKVYVHICKANGHIVKGRLVWADIFFEDAPVESPHPSQLDETYVVDSGAAGPPSSGVKKIECLICLAAFRKIERHPNAFTFLKVQRSPA